MYEDCTGAVIAVCVVCGIGILVLLGILAWLIGQNEDQETCGKHADTVIQKYATMRPAEVTGGSVADFHEELRNCFPSDTDYLNYLNDWHHNRQMDVYNVDCMLWHYITDPYEEDEEDF